MSVNTPYGNTEEQTITNSVLQGDTWGTNLASVQVDSIARRAEEANLSYLYKEAIPHGMLGMVDDVLAVTEAGWKAQEMNTFMNKNQLKKGYSLKCLNAKQY